MIEIPGTRMTIDAEVVETITSQQPEAWKGIYVTVRLLAPLEAIRVHTAGGEGAATRPELVAAGLHGRWFAIGDFVQTYDEYRASRALPNHFTRVALATLPRDAVVNVGICSGLFGLPGGGEQAEHMSGPRAVLRELDATWSHQAGHA